MFRCRLVCKTCEFSTDPFTNGYLPTTDTADVVFQDRDSGDFRVVTLDGIRDATNVDKPNESLIGEAIEEMVCQTKQDSEDRVRVWTTPDEFEMRSCPECRQQSVGLELSAII